MLWVSWAKVSLAIGAADEQLQAVEYLKGRALFMHEAPCMEAIVSEASNRKLVLLGEASHGTHEFYVWRDSISRRLIEAHGFNFIAVEGDWASLYALNRYVKHLPGAPGSAREALMGLERWPQWMWANQEVLALAEWLHSFNAGLKPSERVGFYGMDVYDEYRSLNEVMGVLRNYDLALAEQIGDLYACLKRFEGDSWMYARVAVRTGQACGQALYEALDLIGRMNAEQAGLSPDGIFYLKQNALVVKHAEKFFRYSAGGEDVRAWNARVEYMQLAVNRLLDYYGPEARGIVWAHNTHIGDARFTEMQRIGQKNIGQLFRQQYGMSDVFLLGFATYRGRVKAGSQWGSDRKAMRVPPAPEGSIEKLLEQTRPASFSLLFDEDFRAQPLFKTPLGNRAIGVVYNPAFDQRQYVMSIIPMRYDALVFFRESRALLPLHR